MCLVSVLKKGTQKDTEEVYAFIRRGATTNTDGSGFMYKRNGENTVNISKGYFNIEAMIETLRTLNLTENDELVIHHRIGTSGLVSDENTHPFVISDKHEEICATELSISKPAMVHNGMFYHLRGFMALNPDFSDTYAFARYILGNKHIHGLFIDDRKFFDVLFESVIGSNKIAILYPDKDLEIIGNFLENNGYYHSNAGYRDYVFDRGGQAWGEGFGAGFSLSSPQEEEETEDKQSEEQEVEQGTKEKGNSSVGAIKISEDNKLPKYEEIERNQTYLLLDSNYVKLTKQNAVHFAFVRKSDWDDTFRHIRTGVSLKYAEKFDPISDNNLLTYKVFSKSSNTYTMAESSDALRDSFYYIPRGKYLTTIYKDFKTLVDFKKPIDNVTILQLENILAQKWHKDKKPNEDIYIVEHNETYTRGALDMLLKYYKDNLKTGRESNDAPFLDRVRNIFS